MTKGGFYWHFDGRSALLEEMLDAWERAVVDEVERRVESDGGDARTKLARLFALGSSSHDLLKIEMAIRAWSRRDKTVAKHLKRIDNRRMHYMRSLFGEFCADEDDVEVRCMLTMSLFIGASSIAADYKPRSRSDVLALVVEKLLT